MKLSISVTKRKGGVVERVITFYLDEKNVRHIFKTLSAVDRVYLSYAETGMGVCVRMHPLLKTIAAPAGVLAVPLKALKVKDKKPRTYVARCVVPTAWKLPLLSRNKSNVDCLPSTTDDNLDHCLDIPVPKEWLDKTALKDTKVDTPPKVPPVEKVVTTTPKDDSTADKKMEGKIQSKPAVIKPIRVEATDPVRRDTQDVKDILAQIEHLTGNLNMLLATARAQGVNLDVTVKKGQFRVYRYIPARRKRLV